MSVSRHSPLHSLPPVGSQIDSITIEATADAISPADAARSPPSACTIPGDCPYRRNTPKSSSAITHPHSTHPAVAAIAPSHPLATRSPLSLDDLLTAELLLREPGSAIRDAFDSALLLRDRCAEPAWTSVNSPALAAAAREGLGRRRPPRLPDGSRRRRRPPCPPGGGGADPAQPKSTGGSSG